MRIVSVFLIFAFSSVCIAEGILSHISSSANQLEKWSRGSDVNSNSCQKELTEKIQLLESINPKEVDQGLIDVSGAQILKDLFDARVNLHDKISSLPEECNYLIKDYFRASRALEDYVGVLFYKDVQIASETLDFDKQAIPVFEPAKYRPAHLGAGIDSTKKFEFKSGDIMITKGVSFISSTISQINDHPSLFSHIVFVHYNDETGLASTIESYVGKGVSFFTMEDALKNENARILVLRPKDQDLAVKAAEYMAGRVIDAKNAGSYIPYDYALDFNDNTKLSCEEVAYDAFKTKSDGKFIIPQYSSQVSFKNTNFLNRVGIKPGKMMSPADMEIDPRFEIVLDWTDYRLIRDSWRKDATLSVIFKYMNEHGYNIRESFDSIAARVVWWTRPVPGLWNLMSKLSGIPADYTKDVPMNTITTIASLKEIGRLVLAGVIEDDNNYMQMHHQWMSEQELREAIEENIRADLLKYQAGSSEAKIHQIFRP